MTCSCTKLCSRSAMASLSSANPSCRPSSAFDDAALRERWALSRSELRDDGRSGVVGRERGERERRRWERDEGGSWVGVVDDIVARGWCRRRRCCRTARGGGGQLRCAESGVSLRGAGRVAGGVCRVSACWACWCSRGVWVFGCFGVYHMLWLRGGRRARAKVAYMAPAGMMTPCLSVAPPRACVRRRVIPVPDVQLVAFCRRVRAVPVRRRRRSAEKLHFSPGLLATRLAAIRHCRTRRAIAVQHTAYRYTPSDLLSPPHVHVTSRSHAEETAHLDTQSTDALEPTHCPICTPKRRCLGPPRSETRFSQTRGPSQQRQAERLRTLVCFRGSWNCDWRRITGIVHQTCASCPRTTSPSRAYSELRRHSHHRLVPRHGPQHARRPTRNADAAGGGEAA